MLFTTISEIRKRDPKSRIYFGTYKTEEFDHSVYSFFKASYDDGIQERALHEHMNPIRYIRLFSKLIGNEVLGIGKEKPVDGGRLFSGIDLVIDISGFALSDKIKDTYNKMLLNTIALSKKNNVPVILMPQSFGPFEKIKERDGSLEKVRELMNYPEVIYAREKNGMTDLEETFELKNVKLSTDLVLQSRDIDLHSVFRKMPQTGSGRLSTKDNVAIIPNYQCFRDGNESHMYEMYTMIIKLLLKSEKNIYIVQHSKADEEICRTIKEMFKDEKSVHIAEGNLNCIEFDEYIREFDFVICSRYHGCVHAFRNDIPCIILGWADKYLELAKHMQQEKYVFSVETGIDNTAEILEAITGMTDELMTEKKTIRENVERIQKDSCFDCLDSFLMA